MPPPQPAPRGREAVDVVGHARRVPVQGRGPGDIAFRVAVHGKQAENVGLNLEDGTADPFDLFRQPPGFTVSFEE